MRNPIFWMILILAAINIAAYFLINIDKKRAIHQQWRISENTFFLLCLLGGFIGIYSAMIHFHHKTKSLNFKIILFISTFCWLLFLPYAYFKLS
ncbi:DUF1294 domain-containing protein [Rodentibacter caecimuris]|uniref:DUF1294 domain-containing protein n=1 Tax=Rodentibacter caecimuris TaxID=1796644 RepID=UPI0009860D7E